MTGRTGDRDPRRAVGVLVACGLAAVSAAIVSTDPRPDAVLRHAYLAPVVFAGAAGGVAAGLVSAIGAVLVHAPLVIAHVEKAGVERAGLEGLASFALLLLAGAATGTLASRIRHERRRHLTLTGIQAALAGDIGMEEAARRVRRVVSVAFEPATVAVVITHGAEAAGTDDLGAAAAHVGTVTASGRRCFVPDLGDAARPRRAMFAPIRRADQLLGVLVVVREGEMGRGERAMVAALAAYIGLALENACLAAAQRRFAAELEDKVAAATRELTAIDRAKSAFVATASHELRTPLTALRGFSELLAVRTYPADEVKRFARVMRDQAERLARLVEDLLDLSRLERGLAPQLRRTPLEPDRVVRDAVSIFDRPDVTHRIAVDCPPELPAVDADPDALDRILKNLVANAIKYSPPGLVRVSARAVDQGVEFVVADHGPGIPADALPRLFEPYFRVDDGAHAPRGTGLGLAVVRALIEAHGGRVRVESSREIGTRIRFTIPSVS